MPFASISAMQRITADRYGARPAIRAKHLGRYRDFSWEEIRRKADGIAAQLIALGVGPGDKVGLLSENRVEWILADLGTLAAGAADVTIHAPSTSPQVEYQLRHADCVGLFLSDDAQADKIRPILDRLPQIRFLVSFDPIRTNGLERLQLFTLDGFVSRGLRDASALNQVGQREACIAPDDLATIIYTSGTTGLPKGVMLSHGNLLSNAEATLQLCGLTPGETTLSWLPYSHVYARTVDHVMAMLCGNTTCLAESADTLVRNLAETQPTRMTAVPRFYEKVWGSVEHLPKDQRAATLRMIFGPRLIQLSSGGAPLPRHVNEGFIEAGIPLLEGYGLTESSPVIAFNRMEAYRLGTVGQAAPGVEVRIADDGEILTRGPHVMQGYYKDPEATSRAVVDGWLHTGDLGSLDADGYLTITGRKKELIVTSQGKNIAPNELERLLLTDPGIDQAIVHGDGRPFVSALIVPNYEWLRGRARELGVAWTSEDGRIACPEIEADYAGRLATIMEAVSQPERVKKFVLLAEPFSIEREEVTPTQKLRRRAIESRWRPILDRLYS